MGAGTYCSDDCIEGCSGTKNLTNADGFDLRNVCRGDDSAGVDWNFSEAPDTEGLNDPWEQVKVCS